jgi:hypothetical protein
MSSAAVPPKKHSGQRENHSGLGRKPFAFTPESLFAFSPESRSSSPRNRFHVRPGILFALPRNPQLLALRRKAAELGMQLVAVS